LAVLRRHHRIGVGPFVQIGGDARFLIARHQGRDIKATIEKANSDLQPGARGLDARDLAAPVENRDLGDFQLN